MKVPLEVASWGVLALISTLIVNTYGGCEFKNEWFGKWFINGYQNLLTINSTWIETKGRCLENSNDKYMIEDTAEHCFRCMVIHEKHQNVLQYKETYCDSHDSLDNLCNQIAGDATLYSMFRVDPIGGPVPCPFKGPPFTFTYNRGNGECGNPVSRIDSCTDDSRLSFRYQACPDVQGTESTVEELLCLATWKDGSTRYLVGKLSHSRIKTNEESYRCFVYEKTQGQNGKVTYTVAQSGDATCNGLLSATEGSKVMKLTKVEGTHTKCKYPTWVTDHHHWHTLDYKKSYHFSHKNATLKITEDTNTGNPRPLTVPSTGVKKPNAEMRVVCHSEVKTESHYSIVTAHVTNGCESGYVCLAFYRRDNTVIELQQSKTLVQVPEEACSTDNFNPSKLPFITLITASLHQRKCPHLGRYTVIGQSVDGIIHTRSERDVSKVNLVRSNLFDSERRFYRRRKRDGGTLNERDDVKKDCDVDKFESLNVGCTGTSDTMEFYSSCGSESNSAYSCYGSWEENGTFYLIASPISRKSTEARRYCFISTPIYENNEQNPSSKDLAVFDQNVKRNVVKLMLSTVAESCFRTIQPGINGIKAFNFTIIGQCAESKSPDTGSNITVPTLVFLMTILTLLYGTR